MRKLIAKILSYVVVTLCLFTTSAYAQKLSSVTLNFKPRGTDEITIVGVLPKKLLDKATNFTIEASPFTYTLAKKSLKKVKNSTVISKTFRPKGGGIKSATVDTKSGKYTFILSGVAFSPSPAPIKIRVYTENSDICGQFVLIPVPNDNSQVAKSRAQTAAKYGKINFAQNFKSKSGPLACSDSSVAVSAEPGILLPLTTTSVTFRLTSPKGSVVAASLFGLNSRGAASGSPLCTFQPNSSVPGLWSCFAPITTKKISTVSFLVSGTINGLKINQAVQLNVADQLTPADIAKISTLSDQLSIAFAKIVSSKGNGNDSKSALITELKKNPLIKKAGISPNGVDVYYVLVNGLKGVFPFGLRDGNTLVHDQATRAARTKKIDYSTWMTPATLEAIEGDPSTRVFVYDPKFFDESESLTVQPIFNVSNSPPFALDYRMGENAYDAATFKEMSGAGTIIITTHGLVMDDGDVVIFSRESAHPASFEAHIEDLRAGLLIISHTNIGSFFAITPAFVRKNLQFPEGSILFGGFCYSAFNETLSSAFIEKGLGTYYGFSNRVDSRYAADTAVSTFCSLLVERENTGGAYEAIEPKVDPYDSAKAQYKMFGLTEIDYPGDEDPKPELSTKKLKYFPYKEALFPLQASFGENGELPCISYNWKSSGKLGSFLTGGQLVNDVKTENSKIDFKFLEDAVFGKDTITVDFLRRSTDDKITSEKIELEPYCPVDTTISYDISTPGGLDPATNAYRLKNDETGTVKWNAPGTEACSLAHRWTLNNPRPCLDMSSATNDGDDMITKEAEIKVEVFDCFTGYDPAERYDFTLTQTLYTQETPTEPGEDLHNKQTLKFSVENPCVDEVSPGVFKELCCVDSRNNDSDEYKDCEDPDCADSPDCVGGTYKAPSTIHIFDKVVPTPPSGTQYSFDYFKWPKSSFPAATSPIESWCISVERISPTGEFIAETTTTRNIPLFPKELEYQTLPSPGNFITNEYWNTVTSNGAFYVFRIYAESETTHTHLTQEQHDKRFLWTYHVRLKPAGGCRK